MVLVKLVVSPSTLRLAPSTCGEDKKALAAFAKAHGLRNEYFKAMIDGGTNKPKDSSGRLWQLLTSARWLQHSVTNELVVVIGGATEFVRTERAQQTDMGFADRTLRDKLSNSGNSLVSSADGHHSWKVHPSGFQPPQVATLPDGASLAGLHGSAVEAGAVPSAVLPDYACILNSAPSWSHEIAVRPGFEPRAC